MPTTPSSAPKAPPRTKPAGIDPWALLAALRRHWLLAAILSVLAAGVAGAAVWFLLPPGKHSVTRVLHVASTPGFFDPNQRGPEFHTYKQTQTALLRSRKVLNAALRAPKVAESGWVKQTPEPLEWLEKNVQVNFPGGGEIMQVSLQGSAEEVQILTALVDAVVDAYLREIVEKDRDTLQQREKQLRDIAATYETKVKNIRLSMKRLREQAGTGNPENLVLKQKLAMREYDVAVQELTRLRSEMRLLRTQSEQQQGKSAPQDEAALREEEINRALLADAILAKMKSDAARLERQIDRDAEKSPKGRKAPALQPLIRELRDHQIEIKTREDEIRKTVSSQSPEQRKRGSDLGVIGTRQRLTYLEDLEKLLVKDCDRLAREGKQLNANVLDLEDFTYDLTEFDQMRAALVKKADLLSIEAQAPPRIYRLDQEAIVLAPDEQARKIRFGGIAGAGAVATVLLGICLLELRVQRVTSATEVARGLGLTVVGVLPFYRANRASALASKRLKEAVDDARTLLLHQAEGRGLKTLLVTSAASDEGKTSLACHLAASLARAGRRTLLIDADLRKPDVHNIFARPNTPGLCEVFRGETLPSQAIQDLGVPGLWLMPAGKCCDRALRAVAQNSFASVLDELRQEYDFIIIDSSPVLEVPDALMLGKEADGVLFAVMQGESRSHRLATAADRFSRLDAPILGLIINGAFDAEKGAYGGQYAAAVSSGPPSAA